MPNMKEVCRILDGMQKSISGALAKIDQIEKLVQTGQYFQGGGTPQSPGSPPEPATPGVSAAAAPVKPTAPPPPQGPKAFMDEEVFSGREKRASERKRKEFRDDYIPEKDESEFINEMMAEMAHENYADGIDEIGLSPAPAPSKYSSTSLQQMIAQMAQAAVNQAINQGSGKAIPGGGGGTSGGGAGSGGAAPPPGAPGAPGLPGSPGARGPQGIPGVSPQIASYVNQQINSSAFGLLSNVFGRRIVNMLTPDKLHGGDLLYMAQNIKWIDGKVSDVISKSIAEKVASGQMTKAAAANAGGFMSSEAIGAQLAGGALIGLFIAKHIPKLVEIAKDVSELKDSVNVMMTGDRTFSATTRDLQKASAWATTIDKSAEKTEEMMGSRTILGMKVDAEGYNRMRASLHKIMADDKFLNSAIKQFTENAADSSVFRTGFLRGFSKIWKFA